MAPIAPPPQPPNLRRDSLPAYQMSSAHFSSFHFSVIGALPLELVTHVAAFVGFLGSVRKRDLVRSFNRIRAVIGVPSRPVACYFVAAAGCFHSAVMIRWATGSERSRQGRAYGNADVA